MGKDSQFRIGYLELIPSKSKPKSATSIYSKTNKGKGQLITQTCNEVERVTKSVFKEGFVGCSNQLSKKHKAEVFVEKSTGRTGFKEEIKYTSTMNLDDKFLGCSNQYQTQVKIKKVTFPSQSGAKPALPKSKSCGGSTSKKKGGSTSKKKGGSTSKKKAAPKSSAKGGDTYNYYFFG